MIRCRQIERMKLKFHKWIEDLPHHINTSHLLSSAKLPTAQSIVLYERKGNSRVNSENSRNHVSTTAVVCIFVQRLAKTAMNGIRVETLLLVFATLCCVEMFRSFSYHMCVLLL